MTKAEQAAMRAYPPQFSSGKRYAKRVQSEMVDTHAPIRKIFLKGYEQAEQELAPIVQTAICLYESWQGGTMDEVRRYIVELGHLVQPIRKGGYND